MRECEFFTVMFTGEKGKFQRLRKMCPKNCYKTYYVNSTYISFIDTKTICFNNLNKNY